MLGFFKILLFVKENEDSLGIFRDILISTTKSSKLIHYFGLDVLKLPLYHGILCAKSPVNPNWVKETDKD